MKLARMENGFEFKVKKKKQQREKRRSEAHPKVNYRQYYELIDSDLSDPSRLSILLSWVSKHCKSKDQDPGLEQIKQEIVDKLKSKSINLNWYQSTVQQPTQENPINVQNKIKLSEFQQQIDQYNAEIQEWESILQTHQEEYDVLLSAQKNNVKLSYTYADIEDFIDQKYKDFFNVNLEYNDWIAKKEADMILNCDYLSQVLFHAKIDLQDMYR